jgi:hypothetical protein
MIASPMFLRVVSGMRHRPLNTIALDGAEKEPVM